MREVLILSVHLLVTVAKLLRPGGARAVAAESLLLKHQLLISNRARQRAPNLTTLDRFVLGLTTLFVNSRRIAKLGALVKPATLFKFHRALVDRKYRLLFSSSPHRCKPGPKGPSRMVKILVRLSQLLTPLLDGNTGGVRRVCRDIGQFLYDAAQQPMETARRCLCLDDCAQRESAQHIR